MLQDDLTEVIQRLQGLQLQRQQLRDEERQLDQEESFILSRITTHVAAQAADSSRVDIPPDIRQQRETPREPVTARLSDRFQPGEHVFITSEIRHVQGRRITEADRAAIIDRVGRDRVEIQTYNGFKTWRKPKNLRPLTSEERIRAQSARRDR